MLAFTNTQVTKPQLIAALEAHKAADRIVQGRYWDRDGRGCDSWHPQQQQQEQTK